MCKNHVTGEIDATANLYHDEKQSPGWTGGGNGGPDGVCHGDMHGNNVSGPTQSGYCDCGHGVSCGEYLWDQRNGSMLTDWFTGTYVGGAEYGLGNLNIDGFFFDDQWSTRPSEEAWPISPRGTGANRSAGLDVAEIAKMYAAWDHNMEAVKRATVEKGGFTWQNFVCIDGKTHGNGELCTTPTPSKGAACTDFLRSSCAPGSLMQSSAVTYTIGHAFSSDHSTMNLTMFQMDLAVFLASRGDYSWLGYGWLGCGCGWEYNGKMPCDIFHRPPALDVDYGIPTGMCVETGAGSGVFTRDWTKSTVTIDCNAYTSDIKMK